MLDDTFAEVRELVRGGQKIGAIKLYRDLTGASPCSKPKVVEAMEDDPSFTVPVCRRRFGGTYERSRRSASVSPRETRSAQGLPEGREQLRAALRSAVQGTRPVELDRFELNEARASSVSASRST